jgi:hypothetical protein
MAVLGRTPHPVSRASGRRLGIPAATILAAGFVAAAALLPVAQSSDATSTGNEIRRLEVQKSDLQARIHLAQTDVAEQAAIERVEQRSRELGLVPAERVMYVRVSEPPPAAGMPSRYLNEEEPVTPATEGRPWWKTLLSKLPNP